jgi:hypothetical protein
MLFIFSPSYLYDKKVIGGLNYIMETESFQGFFSWSSDPPSAFPSSPSLPPCPRHLKAATRRRRTIFAACRLMLFMRDGLVSMTTNPVENYYRQTDSESMKRIYRTSRGVLSYLAQKMAYWTVKFVRLPQPPTR